MKTSATALEQYERCPRQFRIERIEKKRGRPGPGALIGRVVHRTLKRLVDEHCLMGEVEPLDSERATDIFTLEWSRERGLSGTGTFSEGLEMIHGWISRIGELDPSCVAGTEIPFEVVIGDVTVVGYLDLVLITEEFNHDTGEVQQIVTVFDYKTTHAFTTSRDAEDSLQLSIYAMAAQERWPSAHVTCELHLLRNAEVIQTRRASYQLEELRRYVAATAQRISDGLDWDPRLNSDCVYCHGRSECQLYKESLGREFRLMAESAADIDALAEERADLAIRKRIIQKRMDEIDEAIKAKLEGESLTAGGHVFRMSRIEQVIFKPSSVITTLTENVGVDPVELIDDVCSVDKKRLEARLDSMTPEVGRTVVSLIKSTLVNDADKKITNRLNVSKERKGKKAK